MTASGSVQRVGLSGRWFRPDPMRFLTSLLLFPRLAVMQTGKKLGVTGTFSGVLRRPSPHFSQHLRIPLWRKTSPDDTRLEWRPMQLDELRGSGWVTGSLAFGGSHINPSHLYSICFLEHIRALRFTQLLYLIEFNLRWL